MKKLLCFAIFCIFGINQSYAQRFSIYAEKSYLYSKANFEDDIEEFYNHEFGVWYAYYQTNKPERAFLYQTMRYGINLNLNEKNSIGLTYRKCQKGIRSSIKEVGNQEDFPHLGGFANFYRQSSHELGVHYHRVVFDRPWFSIVVNVDSGLDLYYRYYVNFHVYERSNSTVTASASHLATYLSEGNIFDDLAFSFNNNLYRWFGTSGLTFNFQPRYEWMTFYVKLEGGYGSSFLNPKIDDWRIVDGYIRTMGFNIGASINI